MNNNDDSNLSFFRLIVDNPGIHFRKIVEISGKNIGVVQYHLSNLEKDNSIFHIIQGNQKLFFDHTWSDRFSDILVLIGFLRKPVPRNIIIALAKSDTGELSMKQLSVLLRQKPSSIHWHFKRMVEQKVLVPRKKNRQIYLRCAIEKNVVFKIGTVIFPNRWQNFLGQLDLRYSKRDE